VEPPREKIESWVAASSHFLSENHTPAQRWNRLSGASEELERSEKSPHAFFHSSTAASVWGPIFPPIFLARQSLPNPYLSFYLSRRVGQAQSATYFAREGPTRRTSCRQEDGGRYTPLHLAPRELGTAHPTMARARESAARRCFFQFSSPAAR